MTDEILVLSTGGTIDKVYSLAGELEIGEPQVRELLAEGRCAVPVVHREVLRKDSLELTDEDRTLVRQAVEQAPQTRVLITHGTDTMPETARFLEGLPGKVVVRTGAMQPQAMRTSDAAFNLGVAIGALPLLPPGVFVAMNGRLFPAATVRKDRARGVFEQS